jgi:hypothetical protein
MTINQAIEKYNDEAWGYELAFIQDNGNKIYVYDIDDDFVGLLTEKEFFDYCGFPQ